MKKIIAAFLVLSFTLTVSSCGTLIYPERIGQSRGRIDPAIAILDGVGVLLLIVPGLIAFIVDFATGAIYLPSGKARHRSERQPDDTLTLHPASGRLDLKTIEDMVRSHTGLPVDLSDPAVLAIPLNGPNAEASAKKILLSAESESIR